MPKSWSFVYIPCSSPFSSLSLILLEQGIPPGPLSLSPPPHAANQGLSHYPTCPKPTYTLTPLDIRLPTPPAPL
jgi:hypothetical protein